jgi:hypothetical protein
MQFSIGDHDTTRLLADQGAKSLQMYSVDDCDFGEKIDLGK